MMQAIRNHATGMTAKIIFGLIVISFIFVGNNMFDSAPSKDIAGSVNKQDISTQDLDKKFNSIMSQYAGQEFSKAQIDALRTSAFDQIVNEILLEQAATQLKLTAGKTEIAAQIQNDASFQIKGAFSRDRYNNFLTQNKLSAEQYEAYLAKDLTIKHLLQSITNSSPDATREFSQIVATQNSRRDIQVASFDIASILPNITVSADEIKVQFEKNVANYTQPERVKLSFVEISSTPVTEISTTDAEIENYFNKHKASFSTPEKREVSQIMIKPDESMSTAQAIEKLNEYHAAIENGSQTFESVSAMLKANPQIKSEIGVMGELSIGSIGDSAIDAEVFQMQKGQVSNVIASSFGVHLFRLDQITPEKTEDLISATPRIQTIVKKEKSESEYLARQEHFQILLETTPDDLASIAKSLNSKVLETQWEDIKNPTGMLTNPDILSAALSDEAMNKGKISPPIAINEHKAVAIKVLKHEVERPLTLEEASIQIETALKLQKALESAKEKAMTLQTKTQTDPTQFETFAQAEHAKTSTFTQISISDTNDKAPLLKTALLDGFKTFQPNANQIKTIISDSSQEGISVVTVRNVISGKISELDPEMAKTIQMQLQQVTTEAEFAAYLDSIKKKSNIIMTNVINP